ncbi:MAG: L,D-transpeptidase family protein [Clostridia bacterium]|nr:L,D-transpeptidase family protein [Clostridia bacterium]
MRHRLLHPVFLLSLILCFMFAIPSLAVASDKYTYCIEVDLTNQITTIVRVSDRAIVRQMLCSTGTGTKTPLGTFKLEKSRVADRSEWYYIGKYACYVKYPTRIKGSILFHSIPYAGQTMDSIDRTALAQLGEKASHGCIRLRWQDARWISENCPDGTQVKIYTGAARKDALRRLLMHGSYSIQSGQSYERFRDAQAGADGLGNVGHGISGEEILALQQELISLGYLPTKPSGVYDNATVIAVMKYQLAEDLPATGVTTRSLMDILLS